MNLGISIVRSNKSDLWRVGSDRQLEFLRSTRHATSLAITVFIAACGGDTENGTPDVNADVASDVGVADTADVGPDSPDTPPDLPDVESDTGELLLLHERGPHQVGYQTLELSYERPDNGETRTLRTAVWYPTEETEGGQPFYFGIFPRDGVWQDAAPAPLTDLPVLVYSHGHYGYAEASADLVEHLTSHGWLVIAPDHTGNTLTNNGQPRETAIYHLRGTDLSAAIDWLEDIPAEHPLVGMPSDRIVAAGHSYGGYTVMTVLGAGFSAERIQGCIDEPEAGGDFCAQFDDTQQALFEAGVRDERISAGILMAAGNFGELGAAGVAQIETPVLQITGGLDDAVRNETNGDPIWDALPAGDKVRVNLPRGCHQTFAVGCGLPGELETARGFELVNTYGLAFARKWGEGDDSVDPVLSGSITIDADEVELTIK